MDSEVLPRSGARDLGLLEPGALHQGVAGLLAGRQLAVVVVGGRGTAHLFIEPLNLGRSGIIRFCMELLRILPWLWRTSRYSGLSKSKMTYLH